MQTRITAVLSPSRHFWLAHFSTPSAVAAAAADATTAVASFQLFSFELFIYLFFLLHFILSFRSYFIFHTAGSASENEKERGRD